MVSKGHLGKGGNVWMKCLHWKWWLKCTQRRLDNYLLLKWTWRRLITGLTVRVYGILWKYMMWECICWTRLELFTRMRVPLCMCMGILCQKSWWLLGAELAGMGFKVLRGSAQTENWRCFSCGHSHGGNSWGGNSVGNKTELHRWRNRQI